MMGNFEEKYQNMLAVILNEKSQQINQNKNDIKPSYLSELGIVFEKQYHLILWNDDVNDMNDVALALYQICKLSNNRAIEIMLEANEKGQAIALSGDETLIFAMKEKFSDRNITTSVKEY